MVATIQSSNCDSFAGLLTQIDHVQRVDQSINRTATFPTISVVTQEERTLAWRPRCQPAGCTGYARL